MATRHDREKLQKNNEKHKNILAVLLSREENKYCADCLAKGPRWASWNLGLLLCIRCSGLHRSLGVHISRVKSVNLDTWTKEQMVNFCSRGNGYAKEFYEAKLPRDFKRPQGDSSLEYFIRDKYERRKYISPVEIPLRSIKDLGLLDEGTPESAQKGRKKELRNKENISIASIAKPKGLKPLSPAIPRPKSLPQFPQHVAADVSPVQTRAPGPSTDDLLGLNSPISMNAPVTLSVTAPAPPSADLTDDLFGPMSSYNGHASPHITASVSSPDLLNGGLSNAATEKPSPESQKVETKMSKDSILSLYSQGTKNPTPNPMISSGNFNMPAQSSLAYQQPAMQTYPNMNMQGMPAVYNAQQQQVMAMHQQIQMQQMSQQMGNVNISGMANAPGYPMMGSQGQATPMQNNMGFNMGYGGQPQQGYMPQQQQMFANVPNGMGPRPGMMGGYSPAPMMVGGVPNMAAMPGQQGANGSAWGMGSVPPSAAAMNSGHTLSNQLWK